MSRTDPDHQSESTTSQSIINGTLVVMAEQGIANLTTKLVSQRADVSTASIHYFFDTKENLIYSAFLYMVKALSQETLEIRQREKHPLARLARSIEVHFSPFHFEAEASNIWPQFWVHAGANPDVARLFHIFSRRIISNHAVDLKEAGLPRAEARLVAAELSALTRGLWLEKRIAETIGAEDCGAILKARLSTIAERTGSSVPRFKLFRKRARRHGKKRT
ncbi:MAG: TetR family transcriptional regulator C-terminal domain-containing protein [Geminicoccaceae bacterium]